MPKNLNIYYGMIGKEWEIKRACYTSITRIDLPLNPNLSAIKGENDEETENPHNFNSYCACVC